MEGGQKLNLFTSLVLLSNPFHGVIGGISCIIAYAFQFPSEGNDLFANILICVLSENEGFKQILNKNIHLQLTCSIIFCLVNADMLLLLQEHSIWVHSVLV